MKFEWSEVGALVDRLFIDGVYVAKLADSRLPHDKHRYTLYGVGMQYDQVISRFYADNVELAHKRIEDIYRE